ncbi:MAG: glycosyltransferase family 4 protein [Bacteroidia bacterium]
MIRKPPQKKKALFLYNRLAGYFIACIKRLTETYPVEVHVVRLPVAEVAPFDFPEIKDVYTYNRFDYNDDELFALVDEIKPDFIFCNGWIDRTYMQVCRKYFGKVATVLTLDNPWFGSIKQYVGTVLARLTFPRMFSNVWVSGPPHLIYARKLGFTKEQTEIGKYAADFDFFHKQYLLFRDAKSHDFPKRIIYVGRYTKQKGVREMWNAFIRLQKEEPNDWELWCLGRGEYNNSFPRHDKIKNMGFVQPDDLPEYIGKTGVFILPSKIEPWGVVVHEFAAAGFPIITSNRTNAASLFLKDGSNGYEFRASDENSLFEAFRKLIHTPVSRLIQMGDNSVELAKQITPDTWSAQVWKWIKEYDDV